MFGGVERINSLRWGSGCRRVEIVLKSGMVFGMELYRGRRNPAVKEGGGVKSQCFTVSKSWGHRRIMNFSVMCVHYLLRLAVIFDTMRFSKIIFVYSRVTALERIFIRKWNYILRLQLIFTAAIKNYTMGCFVCLGITNYASRYCYDSKLCKKNWTRFSKMLYRE